MSFIRPEAREVLLRWRETLIGGAISLGAIWVIATDYGLRRWIAMVALLAGLALIWEGIRRARFPAPGGGSGVVEVDERQVTYFGPSGGGAVSIDQLALVRIRTTDEGPRATDLFWDFIEDSGTALTVPGDAENVSALFDALTALPGADYEAATKAATSTTNATFVIWGKERPRLH